MKSCVVALKIDNILNGINPVYHHYESYPVVWAIQKNHITSTQQNSPYQACCSLILISIKRNVTSISKQLWQPLHKNENLFLQKVVT